jgi:hypothetical protein
MANDHMMVWGPAHNTPQTKDDEAEAVLQLLATLAGAPTYETPPVDLDYERYIEQPRRQGRDPVWESLLAEACANVGDQQAIHKAG